MSGKEYIKQFSQFLFWDADPKELDMDKDSAYVIHHVLEYGEMEDWRLINQYYGLDKIVQICKTLPSLDPRSLSFICAISQTKEEEYRCYHAKRGSLTPWNS